MKRIFIGGIRGGKYALVDDEDFEKCSKKSWYMTNRGRARSNHKINDKWKLIFLHRFIMDFPKDKQIDHKNGDPLDNRRSNLRLCTPAQNQINSPPKSGRRFKGIRPNGEKWEARIKVSQKDIYLGMFIKEIDAARAYNEAAKKYFKEFAWLNPVD